MKRILLSLFLFSAVCAFSREDQLPVDPYSAFLAEAYVQHPQIPSGVLEAVAFTNTRFHQLTGNEDSSCIGLPHYYGVMGLMYDGNGWFRNNMHFIDSMTAYTEDQIRFDARKNILAYADAFATLYANFLGARDDRNGTISTVSNEASAIAATVLMLSELPLTGVPNDFASNSFVYAVMSFMNNSCYAQSYGFTMHKYDLIELFGDNNYRVLSSPAVIMSPDQVQDESGNIYRSDEGNFPHVLSPDYGAALWTPAPSCNFSSRNGTQITAVTIHDVEGTYAGCISWFQNCNSSVSAHYVVRSSDGQITQMVYEADKAWHVGSENPYTIGIEHEGYASQTGWYTNAMYISSAALVSNICADNNIDPIRTGWWPWLHTTYYNQSSIPGACTKVKGHQHFPNQTHNDPGPNWDWNYFYSLINPAPAAITYSSATGNFYDSGGTAGNYLDDERIVWTIAPTNATSVTVNFSSFSAENTWDYLYIYDGANINAPLIGYYTGTNNPGTITSSGGSLTFEWRSDCATTAAGWNATWTSAINTSASDVIAPTTAVNVNGTWQTQNFTASFNDSDNAGGSGLEKSYYQVIDYDGSDWRANNTQGFFSDNFDQATIHPDWTTVTGTWAINNGVLEQSDENLTNTNIYAPLTQNLSNRYLYHWAGKIDGTGSNRRAGFHFFCDNPTATNRGNSYFVWFRVDQSACEWYEVINDTFYLRNSVPMTVNANQWYDWKVIYDRITGKISVYQDNSFIGAWTDPTPLANGNYVSFRSGDSNWQINNFKVYRSRYSNQSLTVSVGNCASCELRYQNVNPSTPAGRIKSIVADTAGNLSAIQYVDVNVDWTAPTSIDTVYDYFVNDIDTSTSATTLWGDWSIAADTNSGLARYWFAVGTTSCDSDIVPWSSNWGFDTVTVSNLSLTTGQWYYMSVRAENGAGLKTSCFSSDGVLVDLTLGVYATSSGAIVATAGPNPFSDQITLLYTLRNPGTLTMSITDAAGKLISITNSNCAAGENAMIIDASALHLSAGTYFITLQTETDRLLIPIIKN